MTRPIHATRATLLRGHGRACRESYRWEMRLRPVAGLLAAVALAFASPSDGQSAASDPPPAPDVLVINSYAPGYQWSDDMLAGVIRTFADQHKEFEPVIQYLDFRRFPEADREAWLIEDLADKCRKRPPRLIITLDNAAFDFGLKYRDRLGPDVPLVFGGVNRFTPDMIAGHTRITGVSEESDYSGTFELIAHLQPRARHVLVITNQTPSALESRHALEAVLPRHAGRYSFEFFDSWTNDALITRVATLPDGWVGLILDVTRDAAGTNNYNNAAFTEALATRARVPLFLTSRPPGEHDWSVDPWDGIGGGLVVASLHGAKVGELALRVLEGEDAGSIPVVRVSPQQLEVDYRQMKRFGLSLDLLPAGTRVINQPVTFYQVHRSRIILAAAVGLLLVGIIVALSLNILWRHRAEQALRRAEKHARAAQKLEAVGLLAGGVAHDFNNILQIIRGHAAFLEDAVSTAPTAHEDLGIIRDAVDRAAQLTRQLLAFSRQQPLRTGPVEINTLATDMTRMLRRVIGEHIELRLSPLPEPCILDADKSQLEQVLLNLCVNARDAMSSGGRLHIELRRVLLDEADVGDLSELRPGPHLALTVSDTGCGMTSDQLQHLFEPFYTTKEAGKGSGMGLAVVYGVVRQHGGAIRVYSEVGHGSVFKILLPLKPPDPAATGTAHAPNGEAPRGAGTILLAEDDPQVRRVAVRILEQNGFRVLAAADGGEALVLVDAHHAEIRLAILDVLMPRCNGREVFDRIRTRFPDIRVLFCSGYSADMMPAGIAPGDGLALIHKPYSRQELLTEVHRLLRIEPQIS